jgi:hypothetical protein
MSKAFESFEIAIRDVEDIFDIWDFINREHKDKNPESLKRSALVMALTAWETYVEDRFKELVDTNIMGIKGSPVYQYIDQKVNNDLRYFHTPNSKKVKDLFQPLLNEDITDYWQWEGYEPSAAKKKLNEYIRLRGDVVHRAVTEKDQPHQVKKDELQKCIRFLKSLTKTMDEHLD